MNPLEAAERELHRRAKALERVDEEPKTKLVISPYTGPSDRLFTHRRRVPVRSHIWTRYMEAYWNWIETKRSVEG